MTPGRTSSFSMPLFRILAAILLASFLPGARADCWIDSDGFEHCDRLSSAARAAIGLAFFLLFLAFILGTVMYRRRRNAQANLAYTRQTVGDGNQFGYGGPGPFAPQYPPQTYNGSPYGYDPATGFASPTMLPPQYAPPPGAPPVISVHKGGAMA